MGREFIDLFDEWAEDYDETVKGHDKEYEEVFSNYEDILNHVANHAKGTVLEFGVGTGNLTEKLLYNQHKVYGVEPSEMMREKAKEKFPNLDLYDGDFLQFPDFKNEIETIVSSYAFHHLTDQEKDDAVSRYSQMLSKGGKIVFADTLYEDELKKQELFEWVSQQGFHNLLHDLKTEYYPLKETMETLFKKYHFRIEFKQLNRYVWLMVAEKMN